MARKSTITTLDPQIRAELDRLLKEDQLTIDQVVQHLRGLGAQLSRSAVGRYHQRFEEIGKRMRESREVAKVWAQQLGKAPEGDVGKLVTELLRTIAFDATLALQEPDEEGKQQPIDTKALNRLALAIHRLETASRHSLEREKQLLKAARETAAEATGQALKKAGMTPELQESIKRDILGIGA